METPQLSFPAFWELGRHHVARDPREPAADDGLPQWLEKRFPEGGLCAFRTSGSEGTPKWVLLTQQAFQVSANAVNAHFQVTARDRWLIAIPEHHVGGFSIRVRASLSDSEVFRWNEKWEPSVFAQTVRDHSITLTSLVPTQVYDLVRSGLTSPPSLRVIAVGGGGMSTDLAHRARELGWPVFQSYGMTETASQIATQAKDSDDATRLEVLPHWDLRTDENDRLIVRGPALAIGYACHDRHAWQFDPIDAETGLVTRDRVRLTEQDRRRFLTFLGRESDWVKVLGELVHLTPIQKRLEEVAADLDWPSPPVVLATPDPRAESRLVLLTETAQPDPAGLLARYNADATSIERIHEHHQVDAFPRSDLGKVRMAELQRRFVSR